MEPGSRLSLSPASLIQLARAAHPAFKYAIVIAGLAAIVAVVLQFGISPATLVFGIIVLLGLMVIFFVFAQAVTIAKAKLTLPALVLTWTFLLLGVGTGVCLFSSAFFDLPLPLKTIIIRSTPYSPDGRKEKVSPSPKDARLAAAILGTWKSRGKLPEGTGWHVQDLQYTLARNGWIEWRGTFTFAGASYPILLSGDWRIEDGKLLYTVKQSNVAAIPQGFHGMTSIVDITDTHLDYLDPGNNSALTTDLRIQ